MYMSAISVVGLSHLVIFPWQALHAYVYKCDYTYVHNYVTSSIVIPFCFVAILSICDMCVLAWRVCVYSEHNNLMS